MCRSFRKKNLSKNIDAINTIATVGPMLIKNELKSIFAAEPIKIFGGSPISVAEPPILDTSAWERINGIGGTLSILTIDRVTGTMSRMVVTLSMNIEATAVNVDKSSISFQRFPLLRLVAFIPTQ